MSPDTVAAAEALLAGPPLDPTLLRTVIDQTDDLRRAVRRALGMKFEGKVRYWRPEQASGLAVVDVPADVAAALGGLKQMRAQGTMNGIDFVSNVMPAGSGRLALSVSQKMLKAAGIGVGDAAEFDVERTSRAADST